MSGIARDVRHRSELWGGQNGGTSSMDVLTFRIERPGMQPVPVQMRALDIEGLITDGGEVRVDAEQRPGKVLKTKRVENLTTGVPVDLLVSRLDARVRRDRADRLRRLDARDLPRALGR